MTTARKIQFISTLPDIGTRGGGPGRPVPAELLEFAEALRKRPRKWAVYPRPLGKATANTTQHLIKSGKAGAFPEGFEAAVRQGVLYVRYVGAAA